MGFKTSIFSFVSGKFYLLKHLLPFPDHKIYVEPFAGSGVVLLNKKPCRVEVYNDINKEFVNFWLVLRDYHFFLRLFCNMMPDSRDVFNDFKNKDIDGKYILSVYNSFLDSMFARAIESTSDEKELVELTKQYKEIRSNKNLNTTFEFLYKREFSYFYKGIEYQGISFKRTDSPENLKVFAVKYNNKVNKISSLKDAFTFFYNINHSFIRSSSAFAGIHYNHERSPEDLVNYSQIFNNKIERIMSFKDAFTFFYKMNHSFSYRGDSYNGISLTCEDARNKIREAFIEKMKEDEKFRAEFKTFQNTMLINPNVNNTFEFFDIKGESADFSKISWIWNRIKNVHFENQDYRKIIPRVDREGVLIYCDPPYFKSPDLCSDGFTVKDHKELYDLLCDIKEAKFILSIDDRSYYENDKWFYQRVERKNRAGSKDNNKQVDIEECIISNFDRTKQVNKPSNGYKKVI